MKVAPKQAKRDAVMQILQTRAATKVEAREKRPSSPVHPPTPAKEAPPQTEDIMRQIAEVEQLKGVGRSPSLLLTQQLAQVAVEAGPSKLGEEEPVRRKL